MMAFWKGCMFIIVVLLSMCHGSETEMEINCSHRSLEGKTVWNCSDTGVFDFPESHVPPEIRDLDFSYNHIAHIPLIVQEPLTVVNCSNAGLQRIYLHHNEIESLLDDTFMDLHCLELLDLSFNHLQGEYFTYKTLQGLHRLKTLILRGNPLVILKDAALDFVEINHLEYADLSQCQLETIEPNAIDHLPFIKVLNLSGNILSELKPEIFRGLNFLKDLDLSNNRLTHVNNKTFYALLALKHLYLESNHIFELQDGAFEGLGRLLELSLRNNKLYEMPYSTLQPLKTYLKKLDLSSNPIISLNEFKGEFTINIEVLMLEKMPRLQILGPHSTKLFPRLKYLFMRGNPSLHSITEHAFVDSFDNLKYVYISNNRITTIHKDTLPWKQLLHLDWSGNPWNCDCYLKWLVTLHVVNQSLFCHAPTKFEGRDLMELHPLDLKCPRSMMGIFVGFLISLVGVIVAVAVFVLWKYKGKCCQPKGGRYVSVYTNEGADDEAKATILPNPANDEQTTV